MKRSTIQCPICQEPVNPEAPETVMPFCSRRCQQIDLGNWLDESYGFPRDGDEDVDDRAEWYDPDED